MAAYLPYLYRDPIITPPPPTLLLQTDWSFIPYPVNTSLVSEEHVSIAPAGPGPLRRVFRPGPRKPYDLVAPAMSTYPTAALCSATNLGKVLSSTGLMPSTDAVSPGAFGPSLISRPRKMPSIKVHLTETVPMWTEIEFEDLKVRFIV